MLPAEVTIETKGDQRVAKLTATGEPIEIGPIEKMSKSKRNTVDPDDIMGTYGADVARWFMLSDSPPEGDVIWSDKGVQGAWRFVQRLWRLVADAAASRLGGDMPRPPVFSPPALALRKAAHRALARVSEDIERLRFNVCVAHIYEFANAFQTSLAELEAPPMADYRWAVREAAGILVRLFHPMMPHLAEECWAVLGYTTLLAAETWPALEPRSAGRGHGHTSGPNQWQEAGRGHGCAGCHKCRDRGCRSGARCGKTSARRQAAQEGDRCPA